MTQSIIQCLSLLTLVLCFITKKPPVPIEGSLKCHRLRQISLPCRPREVGSVQTHPTLVLVARAEAKGVYVHPQRDIAFWILEYVSGEAYPTLSLTALLSLPSSPFPSCHFIIRSHLSLGLDFL